MLDNEFHNSTLSGTIDVINTTQFDCSLHTSGATPRFGLVTPDSFSLRDLSVVWAQDLGTDHLRHGSSTQYIPGESKGSLVPSLCSAPGSRLKKGGEEEMLCFVFLNSAGHSRAEVFLIVIEMCRW